MCVCITLKGRGKKKNLELSQVLPIQREVLDAGRRWVRLDRRETFVRMEWNIFNRFKMRIKGPIGLFKP